MPSQRVNNFYSKTDMSYAMHSCFHQLEQLKCSVLMCLYELNFWNTKIVLYFTRFFTTVSSVLSPSVSELVMTQRVAKRLAKLPCGDSVAASATKKTCITGHKNVTE